MKHALRPSAAALSLSAIVPHRSGLSHRFRCGGVLAAWLLAGVLPAFATTRTVVNTADSGPGSLRHAIATTSAGDTILFSVTGTITLTSGELLINKNLTITGPGAFVLAVSGNNKSRVFEIGQNITVALSGLTIENGTGEMAQAMEEGGGIYIGNLATLTLINSTVSGNSSLKGLGGGIKSQGALTIINSTVSDNSAFVSGGGIFNSGLLTINNSTVSGNGTSNDRAAFPPDGSGGIYNEGPLTMTNSTVAGNNAAQLNHRGELVSIGGGILNKGKLTTYNTLLTDNGALGNCSGALGTQWISRGFDMSDDDSCSPAFNAPGDRNNVVKGARLDPQGLKNNGGPTQTIALLPTSPAVDHVPVDICTSPDFNPVATDQRGVARPQGTACDVGAFELKESGPKITKSFGAP